MVCEQIVVIVVVQSSHPPSKLYTVYRNAIMAAKTMPSKGKDIILENSGPVFSMFTSDKRKSGKSGLLLFLRSTLFSQKIVKKGFESHNILLLIKKNWVF
jgi:hypothetical protein